MDVGVKDFEDIAVYFSEEEWTYLGEEQRRLYKEVMMENYKAVCSLGSSYLKPELISKIERGKEPCVKDQALCDGESPIAYFIINPDFLSKLPEVLNDDDESDCIYLEIDSDSEIEEDTDDPLDLEDDDLLDCVYIGPEVSSVPEPHIKPSVNDTTLCEDDEASDCIYVESEDETTVHQVRTSAANLEEDEGKDEDDSSSDCVYVDSKAAEKSVTYEDQDDEEQGIDADDEEIIPIIDQPQTAHCQPRKSEALNGLDHDRIIEDVSPENHSAAKNQGSPNNNLLNVWYVKRVENGTTSHKDIVLPGSLTTEQHMEDDGTDEEAEHDQITDLEFLCPVCPEIFTDVSKFFEHQKAHEPKTPVCPECGARFSDNVALERHLLRHIEEKIRVCQECGQCFSTQTALESHMKTHKGDKQWPCLDCGKFLYSKSGLDRHMLIHVRDKPVACPQCGKSFIKQINFEMHMRMHAGEEFYPCTMCEKLFCAKAACERHIRAHTMERPHGCPDCGKRFLYNGCLIKHMRVHTGEKPYICPDCGRCFAQSSSLNCHRRLHEDEKPYVCPECKKCFAKKFSFDMHLKIHAKGKLLAEVAQLKGDNANEMGSSVLNSMDSITDVSVRGKPEIHIGDGSANKRPVVDVSHGDFPFYKTPSLNALFNHKSTEDVLFTERPSIDFNGKISDDISLKEKHVTGVNGGAIPRPLNGWPVVDVSFNGRPVEDVTSNKRLVTDVTSKNWPIEDLSFIEDPFIDISSEEQCFGENSFLQIPSIDFYYDGTDIVDFPHGIDPDRDFSYTARPVSFGRKPVNSKAEEKQHICPECGKSFPYNGCLVKHLRTHTGEKPYACSECGKCFAQTSTLNCHKRIHTGERPYICSQCGKGFTSQSHVVRHQAIHNVKRSFLCTGCGKEFSQRSYLIKHHKRTKCGQTL